MWNKLPNLSCAAPHAAWNWDLTGFHRLAEGVSRPPACLPSGSGAEHPGTLPVPPPHGGGGMASPSPALRTASFAQELLGMPLPALFPRSKFPHDQGDDGIYTWERGTGWEFAIRYQRWGCPSGAGTWTGAQWLPRLSASSKYFPPPLFSQEAFNTQIQQPDLQYRLQLCHIYKGK